jgi:nitroreductase
MAGRRTTRHFAATPVPREAVELAIRTAGTAPSGAHQQPWTFVAVGDGELKRRIREAAEAEERENYGGRMPAEWREALAPFGTDAVKPHLTDAPWVVVAFRQAYGVGPDGARRTHYYTQESVGIAVGLFVAAVHAMGLVTLTHTPNPMAFLAALLGRPANEKAFLVMPVGHPAPGARVPTCGARRSTRSRRSASARQAPAARGGGERGPAGGYIPVAPHLPAPRPRVPRCRFATSSRPPHSPRRPSPPAPAPRARSSPVHRGPRRPPPRGRRCWSSSRSTSCAPTT